MYVVKRPFRNLGEVLVAGAVITEPVIIKRFKGRVAEGKIIEVTEQTYDSAKAYFKSKYGVDLPPLHEDNVTEEVTKETVTEKPVAEETVETKSVTVKAVSAK